MTDRLGGALSADAIPGPELPVRDMPRARTCGLLDLTVPVPVLVTGLLALLGVQQVLLWRFLSFGAPWLYAAAAAAMVALCAIILRTEDQRASGPTVRCLIGCGAISVTVFLLGGQGGFFYANPDWIVRDAVLHDMVIHPWPFAYTDRGVPELLRAPIGMYLLPSLAGKAAGMFAANISLLIQNSIVLAVVLALGSILFGRTREHCVAVVIFLFFSGLDILGKQFNPGVGSHLEQWAGVQFSSHITQAFWVPQHALAGWIGAVLYLLWKERRLKIVTFLTCAPLLALWSPLSLIGLMPFAAHAIYTELARKNIRLADIALPLATTAISIPSLLYLIADGDKVGLRLYPIPWPRYVLFETLEAIPFLLAAYAPGARKRFGGWTLAIVAAILLVIPFGQIGYSVDLAMRGSVPALAILSIIIADIVLQPAKDVPRRAARMIVIATLALGAVTPLAEIRRSLIYPPSPPPLCNVFGAAMAGFGPIGVPIYLARVTEVVAWLRPGAVTLVPAVNPPKCWSRPWPQP